MDMRRHCSALMGIVLVLSASFGCSRSTNSASEDFIIQMDEQVEENIYISLDEDFTENITAYCYQVELNMNELEDEAKHIAIAEKYLWPEGEKVELNLLVDEDNIYDGDLFYDNRTYGNGERNYSVTPVMTGLTNQREIEDTMTRYFTEGLQPDTIFFADIDKWFGKRDLSFMSAEDALKICEDYLRANDFEYSPELTEWYAIDKESAEKRYEYLLRNHFAPDTDKIWECYAFLFENKLDNYEITRFGEYISAQQAFIVITEEGILCAIVDCNYKSIEKEEVKILSPKEILDKVVTTLSSVLSSQNYTIYDMKLMQRGSELDRSTGSTSFRPMWVVKVKTYDEESDTESYLSYIYDAVLGTALERW